MELFSASASSNLDSWFERPEKITDHSESAFAQHLLIYWPGESAPNASKSKHNSESLKYLLEQIYVVHGESNSVDGLLGLDRVGGESFERLKDRWKEKSPDFEFRATVQPEKNPKSFFYEFLAPLISNSTNITYVDKYIYQSLWEERLEKSRFIELLMECAPKATLRLLSDKTVAVSEKSKQLVTDRFADLKRRSKFDGETIFNFVKWTHGRWLIFNVAPGRQIAIEFSFSLQTWGNSTFDLRQYLSLKKYKFGEHSDLDEILKIFHGKLYSEDHTLVL